MKQTFSMVLLYSMIVGCVGYDSTLFVTKTNYGVDLSTTPPTLSFDISRTEGVVSPQFEGGKTVPLLASFKASGNNVFSSSLGSTFATGDAAVTMAKLYNSRVTGGVVSGQVQLDNDPKLKSVSGAETTADFQQNDVRPVLFGTRTSVGLGIGWSNMASAFPDSFNLGYNRKELALVPITKKQVKAAGDSTNACSEPDSDGAATFYCMSISPLLATLGFYNEFDPVIVDSKIKAEQKYLQYFATGDAATNMATHPEVREAMISRLEPTATFRLGGVAYGLPVIAASLGALAKLGEHDSHAKNLYEAVESKNFEVPVNMGAASLYPYLEPGTNPETVSIDTAERDKTRGKSFDNLTAYISVLMESTENANDSLTTAKSAKLADENMVFEGFGALDAAAPGRKVTDADLKRISSDLKMLRDESNAQQKRLASDPDIYAAFDYMSAQLAKGY